MRRLILALLISAACPALAADDLSQAAILQARQARITSQPQQALSIMRQAYAQKPGDPDIILNLGYAMIAAGQAREAVDLYDMLTAMQPDNPLAFNAKAVAFDHTGNHYAAQELYEQALALAPTLPLAMNNLAMSYILDDKPEKAIPILEPLALQSNSNAVIRQNLALAYGLTGQTKKSLAMNLRDLPQKDAEENIRFYEHYKNLRAEARSDEEMSRALLTLPEDASKEVTLIGEREEIPAPPVARRAPSPQSPLASFMTLPSTTPAKRIAQKEPKKEAPVAEQSVKRQESAEAKPDFQALPDLAPAAGGPVLPKGYRPSPSIVDQPQMPAAKKETPGEDRFFGYEATRSYPGQ